jgi:hypothetical protein
MAVLENKTGFAGELFTAQDPRGQLYVVLAVRATFDIGVGGMLRRADTQEPLCAGDVYHGEPGASSLKLASDLVPMKAGTDIAMLGTAYAPNGRPATKMMVQLRVGPVEKKVMVFGDRTWSGTVLSSISRPEPFLTLPLVYERAFGGTDTAHEKPSRHAWEPRNPVGKGFRVHKPVSGLQLPNLEAPDALVTSPSDRPPPSAFGFIDRSWQPRASFVGTYDARWEEEQCPLLPLDFDDRYFQTVPPDLTCRPHLRGDEQVQIVGAVPEGVLECRLPAVAVGVSVEYRRGSPQARIPLLDTVVVRPDERKLSLVWRSTIRCPRKIFDVELIRAFTVKLETALRLFPDFRESVVNTNAHFGS